MASKIHGTFVEVNSDSLGSVERDGIDQSFTEVIQILLIRH